MLPSYRVTSHHTGADFEGQLVNRNRGEQIPGVEPEPAQAEAQILARLTGLCGLYLGCRLV